MKTAAICFATGGSGGKRQIQGEEEKIITEKKDERPGEKKTDEKDFLFSEFLEPLRKPSDSLTIAGESGFPGAASNGRVCFTLVGGKGGLPPFSWKAAQTELLSEINPNEATPPFPSPGSGGMGGDVSRWAGPSAGLPGRPGFVLVFHADDDKPE